MQTANPIDAFLQGLLNCDGSDLHLSSGSIPHLRANGRIIRLKRDTENDIRELSADDARILILGTMPERARAAWAPDVDVHYSYDGGELGRYRVVAYHDLRGPGAVLRRIPAPPESMEELGVPTSAQDLIDHPNGLVLLIGPTGAGKSTTMAAMMNQINHRRAGKILTVEDPIEFAYTDVGCHVSQREVGVHTQSFEAAVVSGLRQDPDVVGVGEIRAPDTLVQVLTLAETGHLVITTGHGSSAPGGLARMVGLRTGTAEEATRRQVSGVLRGVVAQTLVPRADGRGRIAAYEVLLRTSSTTNKIRDGNFASLRSDMNDRASGMMTLERSLAELVVRGEVRLEDALAHANDPDQFRGELRALGLL